jgi:RNA polymerase sigma-70 factor (family 1)
LGEFRNYTDQELLSRLREDDEDAFAELYNRYAGKVRSLAFSKVSCVEATQEIVQEIFSSIWERRHSLFIDAVPNYLAVAVKYRAINHIKSQLAFRKYTNVYRAFVKISEEETMEAVQFHNLTEAIEEGVQKLPEKTQLVFRLNRMEGKSIAEIAIKLKLSEKAIKYHIARSLKELRFHLKEFLISLTAFFLVG